MERETPPSLRSSQSVDAINFLVRAYYMQLDEICSPSVVLGGSSHVNPPSQPHSCCIAIM